jgi:flavorubredoxin
VNSENLKNAFQNKHNKVIILYDSLFGNTKKVAGALSRGLEAGGIQVDSKHVQGFNIGRLRNYGTIAIGGPTHMRGLSKPMKKFLSSLRKSRIGSKNAFAFETKALFTMAGSAGKKIIKNLKKMKLKIVYPLITGIVLGKEGPLEKDTLNKMEKTGLEIAEKLNFNI